MDVSDVKMTQEQIEFTSWRSGVNALFGAVGEDLLRPGLRGTPERSFAAMREMLSGYRITEADIDTILKTFPCPTDDMVTIKDIDFVSVCEHHLLPFTGVAHVAYLPTGGKVFGLSKIPRLVDAYSKRLQLQEKLTCMIAQRVLLAGALNGTACVIEATHACVSCRGVRKAGVRMVTSSLTGAFKDDPATRMELFRLMGK